MKFNCGPSYEVRRETERVRWFTWHRWFAWHPVRVGENDCRWLEYVDRKANGIYPGQIFEWVPYNFEYRAMDRAA